MNVAESFCHLITAFHAQEEGEAQDQVEDGKQKAFGEEERTEQQNIKA
jgi:hypothetical protein